MSLKVKAIEKIEFSLKGKVSQGVRLMPLILNYSEYKNNSSKLLYA